VALILEDEVKRKELSEIMKVVNDPNRKTSRNGAAPGGQDSKAPSTTQTASS
jgi:hypothetical protein